jgi:O-acetyl-ADP-ribose deacetylase (regulator of RNase III)
MLHEVTGDILLSEARAIAHGVAPNDGFHSGLALSLREHWPSMYKDFRHHCQSSHPKEGGLWAWTGVGPKGPVHILNLFTQEAAYGHGEKPGRARLEWVGHALAALHKHVEAEKLQSLALSRLATGVGGLSWADVEPLVRQHLGDLRIPIFVYTTYRKDLKASEAGA